MTEIKNLLKWNELIEEEIDRYAQLTAFELFPQQSSPGARQIKILKSVQSQASSYGIG